MGEPQRDVDSEPEIRVVEEDDTLVQVSYSDLFGEEGAEESGPWCVDYGQAIACMSSLEIWMALASGKLDPTIKVWRDGRACWEPISEVAELTSRPETEEADEVASASIPDQSGIRRVRRPTRHSDAVEESNEPDEFYEPEPAAVALRSRIAVLRARLPQLGRPSRRAVQRSLLAAALMGLGALVLVAAYPYMLASPGKLRRVAVDVAERGRFHGMRIQELYAPQTVLSPPLRHRIRPALAARTPNSRP